MSLGAGNIGDRDRAATEGLVGKNGATRAFRLCDAELVVEAAPMLLHRRLTYRQRRCDVSDGRGLREDVAVEKRTAELDEHLPLSRGHRRRTLQDIGPLLPGRRSITEGQPRASEKDLVTVVHRSL